MQPGGAIWPEIDLVEGACLTPAARDRAFRQAVTQALRGRTSLLRGTRDEIVALLKAAQRAIAEILADAPSDYERWSLPRLEADVRRVLAEFGDKGGARLTAAAGKAWEQGGALVDAPFQAALPEARVEAVLQRVSAAQLNAMRAFMTGRIKDVGVEAANRINAELGLVVIGARSQHEAIGAVRSILGEGARARATTIVRTELGRVFSVAGQARLEQIAERVPGAQKKWRASGKIRPRLHHDIIDGQVRDIDKPFDLTPFGRPRVQLMHPHDPKAPAAETINCGCISVPHFASFRAPGFKPLTRAEHLARRGLPPDPARPGLEHDGDTLQDVLDRQKKRAETAPA